ncbi:MAG TPA: substrate-binding domain-containing protein, partial [Longilinea sp.]|nr:substrate-binding domain-containing protein [Longilinea sp.]
MKPLRFVVSLVTSDNDYQQEQAAAAQETANHLGASVEIIYAQGDAINQSQQLLKIIQSSSGDRYDGILCLPVGTGLAQVARAAVNAGMAWVLLSREDEYIAQLRAAQNIPVFCVTTDHEEVGRIQGKQLAALLPSGGSVLYIQGTASSYATQQRCAGMESTKPANVQLRSLRGQWTEESGHKAIESWLSLSTSRDKQLDLVMSQNDGMAIGARKAFLEGTASERDHWSHLRFTGCDGCRRTGQEWVRKELLTATIIQPPTAGLGIELLTRCLQTGSP